MELTSAEEQLNVLIERRASREPDPDELEPSYQESVRRHRERIRSENAAAWKGFHDHMRETHERLAAEHAAKAAALQGGPS